MKSIDKAKKLLVHYFKLTGIVRDSDNIVEIEEIIDHIIDAAIDRIENTKK